MLQEGTPNYCLSLETALPEKCLFSLELNLNYVLKTIREYSVNRLPHKLTLKLAERNLFCFKEWNNLGEQFQIQFNIGNLTRWEQQKNALLSNLQLLYNRNAVSLAQSSVGRIYKHLDFSKGSDYLYRDFNKSKLMWIFKARTDTLFLNCNRFNATERQKMCSLCRSEEIENMEHFIGRCPILQEFRRFYFGRSMLELQEVIDVLNGTNDENWEKLYSYTKQAFNYRNELISEFNF